MEWVTAALGGLTPKAIDLVVLPEYSNCPGLDDRRAIETFIGETGVAFLRHLKDIARRLRSLLAANVVVPVDDQLRNRTVLVDASGQEIGHYDKINLTAHESRDLGLTAGCERPQVRAAGVNIGFATCFDVYFASFFEDFRAARTDLIIFPSYQRSEEPWRIRTTCQCRALDSGAHIVRSSYAMGRSDRGGTSLIVAPSGEVLADAGSTPGLLLEQINVHAKYVSRSHTPGEQLRPHAERISALEKQLSGGRCYRRLRAILDSPYPWVCAHRGLSGPCPENTLPAFGAAVALGVQEVEIDVRLCSDGVPVVFHDTDLRRIAGRQETIEGLPWAEVSRVDAGSHRGSTWAGTWIPRLEQVLDVVDGRALVNIHVKSGPLCPATVRTVCEAVEARKLDPLVYIAGDEEVLAEARAVAPQLARCCLARQDDPARQLETALEYGCRRIQFSRAVSSEMVADSRRRGLICNLFYSNEPRDARDYVSRGIQVILSDCAHLLVNQNLGSRGAATAPTAGSQDDL
jgi:glycerophosphoryl diester phosphodiesterase